MAETTVPSWARETSLLRLCRSSAALTKLLLISFSDAKVLAIDRASAKPAGQWASHGEVFHLKELATE